MKKEEIMKKIDLLYAEYKEECEDIAEGCIEEGYPSNGSNYELRSSSLWDDYYKEQIYFYESLLED